MLLWCYQHSCKMVPSWRELLEQLGECQTVPGLYEDMGLGFYPLTEWVGEGIGG